MARYAITWKVQELQVKGLNPFNAYDRHGFHPTAGSNLPGSNLHRTGNFGPVMAEH